MHAVSSGVPRASARSALVLLARTLRLVTAVLAAGGVLLLLALLGQGIASARAAAATGSSAQALLAPPRSPAVPAGAAAAPDRPVGAAGRFVLADVAAARVLLADLDASWADQRAGARAAAPGVRADDGEAAVLLAALTGAPGTGGEGAPNPFRPPPPPPFFPLPERPWSRRTRAGEPGAGDLDALGPGTPVGAADGPDVPGRRVSARDRSDAAPAPLALAGTGRPVELLAAPVGASMTFENSIGIEPRDLALPPATRPLLYGLGNRLSQFGVGAIRPRELPVLIAVDAASEALLGRPTFASPEASALAHGLAVVGVLKTFEYLDAMAPAGSVSLSPRLPLLAVLTSGAQQVLESGLKGRLQQWGLHPLPARVVDGREEWATSADYWHNLLYHVVMRAAGTALVTGAMWEKYPFTIEQITKEYNPPLWTDQPVWVAIAWGLLAGGTEGLSQIVTNPPPPGDPVGEALLPALLPVARFFDDVDRVRLAPSPDNPVELFRSMLVNDLETLSLRARAWTGQNLNPAVAAERIGLAVRSLVALWDGEHWLAEALVSTPAFDSRNLEALAAAEAASRRSGHARRLLAELTGDGPTLLTLAADRPGARFATARGPAREAPAGRDPAPRGPVVAGTGPGAGGTDGRRAGHGAAPEGRGGWPVAGGGGRDAAAAARSLPGGRGQVVAGGPASPEGAAVAGLGGDEPGSPGRRDAAGRGGRFEPSYPTGGPAGGPVVEAAPPQVATSGEDPAAVPTGASLARGPAGRAEGGGPGRRPAVDRPMDMDVDITIRAAGLVVEPDGTVVVEQEGAPVDGVPLPAGTRIALDGGMTAADGTPMGNFFELSRRLADGGLPGGERPAVEGAERRDGGPPTGQVLLEPDPVQPPGETTGRSPELPESTPVTISSPAPDALPDAPTAAPGAADSLTAPTAGRAADASAADTPGGPDGGAATFSLV
ncbi:MAG TPA: hypothetical protein VKG45_05460 [Actinomycetes bacterium]|nr:hypothetical protein [Actinomycetes bacterium]